MSYAFSHGSRGKTIAEVVAAVGASLLQGDSAVATLKSSFPNVFGRLSRKDQERLLESQSRAAERSKKILQECRDAMCPSTPVFTDGTLAPCFPLYDASHDWGTVEHPRFETGQLNEMKQECQPHCFSTLNHIVSYCYNDARVIRWLLCQAMRGFQGVTNFE